MNSSLAKFKRYPFERLRLLFKEIARDPRYAAINLGIGEPKHATPEFIRQTLTQNLSGLANYPATAARPETGEILHGRVPAGPVIVSGNLPAADGKYSLYCAVIVKRVDAKTRAKTSINELLRSD